MAENKTQKTGASVDEFLASVPNEKRRADGLVLLDIMKDITGLEPEMWGPSIIGFGEYHYRYESGREGDMPLVGFSPRSKSLSLYVMPDFGEFDDLLSRLGKHRTGVSCLYVNKLDDVDTDVLRELIARSYHYMRDEGQSAPWR